jgi:gas vesicle protein
MKKISLIALAVLMIAAMFITVARADDSSAEPAEPRVEIGREEAEEIVEVLENTSSKAEAILMVAERLGITAEEAERLIDVVLEVGDAHFGEDQWWIAFKNNAEEDIQYWTTTVVLFAAGLSVAGGAVVLLSRTNPNIRKIRYGVSETVKIAKENAEANSQSLGNITSLVTENNEKNEMQRQRIDEKEKQTAQLLEKITELEESNERERRDMLITEGYNLRMLKLIIDRTPLPLADKATIDLFYAKGMEPIRAGLSAEDLEKMDQTIATLDKTKNNE